MIFGLVVAVVLGLLAAIWASKRAVGYASDLAFGYNVPPFVVGAVILAIGTDLPEIASSVVGAFSGSGDVAAGTATGSTITQMTLVLGVLPFVGGAMASGPHRIVLPGVLMAIGLLAGAYFGSDDLLTRTEGLFLVGFWLVSSVLIYRQSPLAGDPTLVVPERRPSRALAGVFLSLAVVGIGATVAVSAFIELADELDVPVFLLSFFAASIGTSLPELVVDVIAVRSGEKDLAIGDIFGSSLIDATLALGIGPLLIPLTVDGNLVVRSGLAGALIVAIITLLLARRGRHDRISGAVFLLIYAALYPVLLA
ncbi:MAG: sodium:calcium antiporter [Acidimicrobiia bacterium]|nr:sodium:calcium antiporter [Acidimicrobiia bacterium]